MTHPVTPEVAVAAEDAVAPPQGLIFDIKKFAIHDGPGIRTTVFFKGCPLACWWCHNPEALRPRPELVLFADKCIGCGECFRVCPHDAHGRLADGTRHHDRDACTLCGRCVETCYAEALVMEGRQMTVDEVLAQVRKDVVFYRNSGGGVTLSGGEPTLQPEFALALLRQCKAEGLHTALDTCGQTPWRTFAALLRYVDLVLYDVKHIDGAVHKAHTGSDNARILDNLTRIAAAGTPVEVRMPVIPGINDADDDVDRTGAFLAHLPSLTRVELLPYHKLGVSKYARLGRDYRLAGLEPPPPERLQALAAILRGHGLTVQVGR